MAVSTPGQNKGQPNSPGTPGATNVGHAFTDAQERLRGTQATPAASATAQPPAPPAPASTPQPQPSTTAMNNPSNAPSAAAQAAANSQRGFISLRGGSRLIAPISRTRNAEVLAKLMKAGEALIKEQDLQGFNITLLPVDMESTNRLTVSALVLCATRTGFENIGVAFHSMLLAGSAPQGIPPRYEPVAGAQVEVIRTPGDADDDIMAEVVLERVMQRFPNMRLNACAAEVVKADFNADDEASVRNLFANAAMAAATMLQELSGDIPPLVWANVAADTTINVRPIFGHGQTITADSLPARSDILIEIQAAPLNPQNNNQSVNNERPETLFAATAFLDLVYAPLNDPAVYAQNPFAAQQLPANTLFQTYEPRLVVTNIDANVGNTPEDIIFGLSSLPLMAENNMWAQGFKAVPGAVAPGEIDRNDIGAVNIEVNFRRSQGSTEQFGEKIDTKEAGFTAENFAQLVNLAFVPRLRISVDVPECGAITWFTSFLSASAEGNPKAQRAMLDAANTLTAGNFDKHFDGSKPWITDEQNRIHMGTYLDRQGIARDIRDIGYLAVSNVAGVTDPKIIRDWSDTFNRTEYPLFQRLAARKRILAGIVGEANLNITGFARRVSISHTFFEAVLKGLADCGLQMRQIGQDTAFAGYQRAIDQFGGFNMQGSTGMFSRAGYQSNQPAGYGRAVRGWA